jgi:hypothetical protein
MTFHGGKIDKLDSARPGDGPLLLSTARHAPCCFSRRRGCMQSAPAVACDRAAIGSRRTLGGIYASPTVV